MEELNLVGDKSVVVIAEVSRVDVVSLEIVAVAVVIDLGEIPWSNLSWVVIPVLLTVGFDSMAVFVS